MVLWRLSSRLAHPSNHFHPRARQPQGPAPAREGARALPGQGDSMPRWLHRASTWMRTFSRQGQDPFYLTQIKEGYSWKFLLLKIYKECNLPIGIVCRHILSCPSQFGYVVHPPPNEPTGFWTNSKHADQGAASRTTVLQNTNVFSTESLQVNNLTPKKTKIGPWFVNFGHSAL